MQYRIHGRIVDEVGQPVSGLIVHALDLDRRMGRTTGPTLAAIEQGTYQRMGSSIVTDGAFEIVTDRRNVAGGGDTDNGPDVVLQVTTPERDVHNGVPHVLHVSQPRANAGPNEAFHIVLHRNEVDAAVPRETSDRVAAMLGRIDQASEDEREIDVAMRTRLLARAKARVQEAERTASTRAELRRSLSRVPRAVREGATFVDETRPLADALRSVVTRGLDRMRARTDPRPSAMPLSASGLASVGLTAEALEAQPLVSGEAMASLLASGRRGGGFPLVRRVPVPGWFRVDGSELDRCMQLLLGPAETDNPPAPEPTAAPESSLVDRLLEAVGQVAVAEGHNPLGSRGRLAPDRLAASLAAMESKPGPADVPVLRDVNVLQLAFEHVWQEVADETGIAGLAEAHDRLVEPGSDSDGTSLLSRIAGIHATRFLAEAELAAVSDPPLAVAEHFGISAVQWESLPAAYRSRISAFATMLSTKTNPGVPLAGPLAEHADLLFELNTSVVGRQLVREIKSRVQRLMAAAGAVRTRGTVRTALDQRRRVEHAFTVFAADADGASVNYGLLTTYRQTWTPVAYQVGELARTVTLGPKEVRRYTVKRRDVRRRDDREQENVLEEHLDSQATTGRAEEDIDRAASVNTAASVSNQTTGSASGSIPGLGSGELENTFSTSLNRTASQQSKEAKKRFREAVTRAETKVRRERKLDVQLHSETSTETEEHGELSNPNDELTCTYLFYELQRRYQVDEQIHAAQPVILVAQTVPRPDEIDEDWILSYDWILRQVVPDPSFIPAIDYLRHVGAGAKTMLASMEDALRLQRDAIDAHRERVDEASLQGGVPA